MTPHGNEIIHSVRYTAGSEHGSLVKTVAVIGASNQRHKFGNQAVRSYRAQGYRVVPINTHESTVEGLTAYRSVLDVPFPIDLASIYLPPAQGLQVLPELVDVAIREVWINPGADSPAVIARAQELGLEPIVACSLMSLEAGAAGG